LQDAHEFSDDFPPVRYNKTFSSIYLGRKLTILSKKIHILNNIILLFFWQTVENLQFREKNKELNSLAHFFWQTNL